MFTHKHLTHGKAKHRAESRVLQRAQVTPTHEPKGTQREGGGQVPPIVQAVLSQPGKALEGGWLNQARLDGEARGAGYDFSSIPAGTLRIAPAGSLLERQAEGAARQAEQGGGIQAGKYDLSRVRVHTDEQAAESARAVGALAYTVGNHIVFEAEQYNPHSASGQRLLAHELAHVVQQGEGLAAGLLQRDVEPPRPTAPASVKQKFTDLPEGRPVSDPSGQTHGIQIERRGQDLFYHLPQGGGSRRVPRPPRSESKSRELETIVSIAWGVGGPYQTAFRVDFSFAESYSVNFFGEGRFQSIAGMLMRLPPALEVHREGLELERQPGALSETRPTAKRFADADRYHYQGATFSMYVFPSRRAEVVEDTSGRTIGGPWSQLKDLNVSPLGMVNITWSDPVGIVSVQFDLSRSSFSLTGLGKLGAPANRDTLIGQIRSKGIDVLERGSRFTEIELEAAWDLIQRWRGKRTIVEELKARGTPGLKMVKDVLISDASYSDTSGEVKVPGQIETTPAEQRNTIIHEFSHALFHARGLFNPKQGKLPQAIQDQARTGHTQSDLRLIDEGVVDPQGRRKPRELEAWQQALSTDVQLNRIWLQLHQRFAISDPESTADIRGLDVADESRYLGSPRGDVVGHGFDNVTEFISSFVSSTLRFQTQMSQTIERSRSTVLAGLYRNLWEWVNMNMINLGAANPYDEILLKMTRKPK